MYQNNHTINESRKFLKKKNLEISKIESVDENIKNEKNIFFQNKNTDCKNKVKTNYKLRHYKRIINGNPTFKDIIFNYFEKIILN